MGSRHVCVHALVLMRTHSLTLSVMCVLTRLYALNGYLSVVISDPIRRLLGQQQGKL